MESLRLTVPEIWPGQKWQKKRKKKKKNEHVQNYIASPTGIANNNNDNDNDDDDDDDDINVIIIITRQVLGRPVCDRGAIPRTLVKSNVV